MELRGYGSIARRWWLVLLLAAWGGGVLGYVATVILPGTYEAKTQLLVGPIDAAFTVQRASGNLARTFADLATSRDLLAAVVADMPQLDAETLEETVRTTSSEATRLVSIFVQQPDPELAAQSANAIVERLIQLTDSPTPEGQITVIDVADVPDEPIGPSIPLVIGMGSAAAVVGAVLLLFLWESTSKVVRGHEEAVELAGAPLLGVLRRARPMSEPARGSGSLMVLAARLSAAASRGPANMVIVGTSAADTSSAWTAAHLAADLAGTGLGVTLVDGGLGSLTQLMTGKIGVNSAAEIEVQLGDGVTIRFRPAAAGRTRVDDGARAKRGGRHVQVISAESADSGAAGAWIDVVKAVVVVVTQDEARQDDLARTASALSMMGAELVGVVVVEPVGRLSAALGRGRPARRGVAATGAGNAAPMPTAQKGRSSRRLTESKEDPRPRTDP